MQTKSYRALKWTLFMGLAASLASACVVSTGDGDDDDVTIDGGDGGTNNTSGTRNTGGTKAGTSSGGTSAGTSSAGTAGTGTAGSMAGGGAGGGDGYMAGACESELKTPSVEGSCTAKADDNDCGKCLKAKCCDSFGACYGTAPTSACGYGPTKADDLGQFDCIKVCYENENDGVKSLEEILGICEPMCLNQCDASEDFVNDDTSALVSCALNGLDDVPAGNDDCSAECFPPAE